MTPLQVLFVDDDPAIRLTLPAILSGHGYEVTTKSSVPEALSIIASRQFAILISDLNIGHPGDGFAVVSAMRRTQPSCINFILTGYPAFETALQALRSHVDDYLVKAAHVEVTVAAIKAKLQYPQRDAAFALKQVATIVRENAVLIVSRVLEKMKAQAETESLSMSDEERIDHIPALLFSMAEQLESEQQDAVCARVVQAAARHGNLRHAQGYTIPMIVEDIRVIDEAVYETLQDHLISLDLSNLIPDLKRVNRFLECNLRESLRAYVSQEKNVA